MKVLLLTLLFLLCSIPVLTLKCYTCEGTNCKVEKDCPDDNTYCRAYDRDDKIERTCEEFCSEDYFTNCCQDDLCN